MQMKAVLLPSLLSHYLSFPPTTYTPDFSIAQKFSQFPQGLEFAWLTEIRPGG
jgi:hypothetical protein